MPPTPKEQIQGAQLDLAWAVSRLDTIATGLKLAYQTELAEALQRIALTVSEATESWAQAARDQQHQEFVVARDAFYGTAGKVITGILDNIQKENPND